MAIDALTTSGIESLVSSYILTEQNRAITPLDTRKSKYQDLITGYSTISSKLDSLNSLLKDLKATGSSSLFVPAMAATLSNSSFMTATATSTATAGSYTMRVQQLAKADITVSKQDLSSGAKLANGTYNFQIVSGSATKDISVTIDDTVTDFKSSLQKIKDAINTQASDTVSAAAFSPDSTTSRLSITAKNMGMDNQIVLQEKDGTSSAILGYLGYALNANTPPTVDRDTVVSDGSSGYIYDSSLLNAKFQLNGMDIQRNTNVVSDLVEGVTFTLSAEMQNTDPSVNVSIAGTTSSIKSKITDFVSKFNDVYNYVKVNSSTSTVARGKFTGDATAISLMSGLTNAAYTRVVGIPDGQLGRLADLGITFTSDGGLTVSDSSKLDSKIANNLSEVEAIFNSDNGVASKLYNLVNPYLGSDGYLAKMNANYNNTITDLSSKITAAQTRIDKSADILRNKYYDLQTQLATLLTTSSMFSSTAATDSGSYF
ncbi:MAG TPA: flagellar filament capping protein FliD [Ignavibacteriales bacterium]|nr:flagellar filament capping protein FliD [Ignavibacteriales bacterium]